VHGADYFRRWHRYKNKSGGLMVHKSSHHVRSSSEALLNHFLAAIILLLASFSQTCDIKYPMSPVLPLSPCHAQTLGSR